MYTIGFYAFQSVFIATTGIYSNSSYFISCFGAGDIMYIILTCIFILTVLNKLIIVHIYLQHFLVFFILSTVSHNVDYC